MNAKLPISLLLVAALAAPVLAASRQAVPRSGGYGPRGPRMSASAPRGGGAGRVAVPRGGSATRPIAASRPPAARGTASGVARYGYGGYAYGYPYYGYGYPYYPYYSYWGSWWYPWWGVGWYGCGDCYGPGYYTAPSTTYVSGDEAPVTREPAKVETKVSPSSATVTVDGEEFGFAGDYDGKWDHLTIGAGKHSVAFRAKGYRSLTIEVDAEPGATYVFKDALVKGEGEASRTVAARAQAPEPPFETTPVAPSGTGATGRLRIHAEPGDAAIYLDGEYLGLAGELSRIHAALAVPAGSHRLEAVRPGFSTAVRTIEVGESDLAVVEVTLDAER